MGGASKGGGGKIEVTDYLMSIHYGFCHGPVDAITSVIIGEKVAWTGEVTEESNIDISRTDLFGGPKKEGGVGGAAYFLPGGPTQVLPEDLAERLGKTSATAPGYRSVASLWFVGTRASYGGRIGFNEILASIAGYARPAQAGFFWGTNNPYLRGTWATIRRSPKVLATDLRMIGVNANPAAIIYECLTNREWGMGAATGTIDTASFTYCAQILRDENFGLSLQWTKQAMIEDFISEILDHIQATLFVNPRTGLMTLKLVRADYVLAELPILNPDNCRVVSFDRKAWGETTNEIVVTWTNPENEQEETVTAQNLANITIQGGEISDSRNYYGVRDGDLAMDLAVRDLASASSPMASFEIEVDRSAWDFVPGSVARLFYPEKRISDLLLRIFKIDYGKPGQPTIKLSCMEDVFSNPTASFSSPVGTEWIDPAEDPSPMEFVRVITAPYYLVSRGVSVGTLAATEYPDALAAVLASQDGSDTAYYELIGVEVLPNGSTTAAVRGTKPLLGYTTLAEPLPSEAESLVETFGSVSGGPGPRTAGFVFIGNKAEEGQEIALLKSSDEAGWVLSRGVLDTVPRAWPSGTPVWFVSSDSQIIDPAETYAAGDEVNYKLLSITSRGTLSLSAAPLNGAILSARPHLPTRPANVTVAGTSFGSIDLSAAPPTSVTVTWSNRNRLLEDNQVLEWTEAGFPPESGQTTTVYVFATDGTLLTTHNGLTGETFALPIASFAGSSVADIRVTAKRGDLESLQGHTVRVRVGLSGYGDSYGYHYGAAGASGTGDPAIPDPGPGYEPDPVGDFPEYPDVFEDFR